MATAKEKTDNHEGEVQIMIPYVEGQDPIQYVGINGKSYQIKKGATVWVPKCVASALADSNQQMMQAIETQRAFKNQKIADL